MTSETARSRARVLLDQMRELLAAIESGVCPLARRTGTAWRAP
jgi:hypothetical protein